MQDTGVVYQKENRFALIAWSPESLTYPASVANLQAGAYMQLFRFGLRMLIAASAAALVLIAPADAADKGSPTHRGVYFSGVDVAEGSTYTYSGVIVAWNGDLARDGVLVRAYGSWVGYDRDPGDGTGWQGDAMIGYRFTRGPVWGSIFIGVDVQDYDLDPDDPTERVRGSETGFKVAGDLSTAFGSPVYASIAGNYSTAFDSFWVRGRLGLYRSRVTWGAEASAFGNIDYEAQRLGGFVTLHDLNPFQYRPFDLTFSLGHQFVNDDNNGTFGGFGGGEGFYGAIAFSMVF
jgi:hypothetical protein